MSDYTELQKAAAYAAQDAIKFADEDEEIRALQQFHEEVDPETVLALIAENEELGRYLCTCRDCGGEGALHTGDWHSYGHMEPPEPVMEKCGECDGTGLLGEIQDLYQVITERDQLKAELEKAQLIGRLAYNFDNYKAVLDERDQLKAENERLAAACERAEQIIIVECKAASLAKVRANLLEADRDQLRAEIAGLKTGYEAYERVNAELKAEVEGLRKDSESYRLLSFCHGQGTLDLVRSHHELCAEIRRLKILSGEPVPPTPEEFVGPSPEGPTARIRRKLAAMGQGEQS